MADALEQREETPVAFVRLALFPGATHEHYARLAEVMAGVPVPQERLVFAAGAVDGGWQVVQVWRSQADLDAFNRAHFVPALSALGGSPFPAPPVVTDFEAADLALGPSVAPLPAAEGGRSTGPWTPSPPDRPASRPDGGERVQQGVERGR